MAKLPTRRTIFDLVGEGHRNDDGSSRLEELRQCIPGVSVTLQRQPSNSFDANAILVLSHRGVGIGYLPREDSALLAPAIDDGRSYRAQIHELTGGLPDYPNIGCKISIAWDGRDLPSHRPVRSEQTLIACSVASDWIPPRLPERFTAAAENKGGQVPLMIWLPAVAIIIMVLIAIF